MFDLNEMMRKKLEEGSSVWDYHDVSKQLDLKKDLVPASMDKISNLSIDVCSPLKAIHGQ